MFEPVFLGRVKLADAESVSIPLVPDEAPPDVKAKARECHNLHAQIMAFQKTDPARFAATFPYFLKCTYDLRRMVDAWKLGIR